MALETNTLTPLLKRMEAAGLVNRRRDAGDERQVRIRLAPGGAAMQARAAHVPGCFLAATGLTVPEAAVLRDTLQGLRDRMKPR